MYRHCRECRRALTDQDSQDIGLCQQDEMLASDYARYDALREEGYTSYQAKLMAGLADPPDPDHN